MSGNTSILRYGNTLERQQWMVEGIIQEKSQSFWNGLIGNSADSVIYQKNDLRASEGMTINFDYKGNLATAGFRGREQAFGNAPVKFKFSDQIVIEDGRYTVDNGREFDAAVIGDIDLSTHEDSRSLLADNFIRAKDQMFFDLGSGYLRGEALSHVMRPSNVAVSAMTTAHKMSWSFLVKLETAAKTGKIGTYERRSPIKPFKMADGKKYWLVILDSYQIQDLLEDTKFQSIYTQAQVRGNGNELISHAIAKVGSLIIMEAQTFFGESKSNELFKQSVETAGLRTIDQAGTFSGTTTAQTGKIASRGFLVGAGAFQFGVGKMMDYKFQPSQDFGITSESCVETWLQAKRCNLTAEVEDYKEAKVANMDYSLFAFDTYNETLSA